jgi:hypothetical protein
MATTPDFHPRGPGSIPCTGGIFVSFFKYAISFRRFCDFGGTRGKERPILNENLRLKL